MTGLRWLWSVVFTTVPRRGSGAKQGSNFGHSSYPPAFPLARSAKHPLAKSRAGHLRPDDSLRGWVWLGHQRRRTLLVASGLECDGFVDLVEL